LASSFLFNSYFAFACSQHAFILYFLLALQVPWGE
jgi:hypothetical protein